MKTQTTQKKKPSQSGFHATNHDVRRLGEKILAKHNIDGEVDMAVSLSAISQLRQGMGLTPEYGALSLALVGLHLAGGPSGLRDATDRAIDFFYLDAMKGEVA